MKAREFRIKVVYYGGGLICYFVQYKEEIRLANFFDYWTTYKVLESRKEAEDLVAELKVLSERNRIVKTEIIEC